MINIGTTARPHGGHFERAELQRPRLAVIPPHRLFGIKQHRLPAGQKYVDGGEKIDHRARIARQRQGVAVLEKKAVQAGKIGVIPLAYNLIELALGKLFFYGFINDVIVERRKMVAG